LAWKVFRQLHMSHHIYTFYSLDFFLLSTVTDAMIFCLWCYGFSFDIYWRQWMSWKQSQVSYESGVASGFIFYLSPWQLTDFNPVEQGLCIFSSYELVMFVQCMCSLRRYIVILMNQRAVGHGETLLNFSTFRSIAFHVALSYHWSNCLRILSYCMTLLSVSVRYVFLLACTIYELSLLFFNLLRFKPFLWHFLIWHRKDEQLYFRRKVWLISQCRGSTDGQTAD
jgi:hypothetical protein